jgi:hypothetical protein
MFYLITWFILWAVLWAVYFMLDGFDLGLGIMYPFLGKDEAKRSAIRASIGPVWDGNEVWLITAGGATFAAFPAAYATLFSELYLAMLLILFGLIIRGVSLEFRSKGEAPGWKRLWDAGFFAGSLVQAFLFGVAFGNLFRGLPIDARGLRGGLSPKLRLTEGGSRHIFRSSSIFFLRGGSNVYPKDGGFGHRLLLADVDWGVLSVQRDAQPSFQGPDHARQSQAGPESRSGSYSGARRQDPGGQYVPQE